MNEILQANIFSELGLDKLPTEKKKELLDRMVEIIQKRIALRVMPLLSEEELDEYLEIDDGLTNYFLIEKIPNYQEIITEELVKFKEEMRKD